MIVDSSALVAIALNEPDAPALLERLAAARGGKISAANLLETWMVIDRRRNAEASALLETLLDMIGLDVEPVTRDHIGIARDAFARFGRGSGHRARLNFGDCFAYALAKYVDEPLLFIGDDFSQTDITPAIAPR